MALATSAIVGGMALSAAGSYFSASSQAEFEEGKLVEERRQFDKNHRLSQQQFREGRREYNKSFAQNSKQFDINTALTEQKMSTQRSQFGASMSEGKRQFDTSTAERYKMFEEGNVQQKDMFGLQTDENRRAEIFRASESNKDRELSSEQFERNLSENSRQFDVGTKDRRRGIRSSEKQQTINNSGFSNM